MKTDLFTFGEALSVFISSDTDSVMSAKKFERVTAGAEVNVAVTLSRLGLKSAYFSRFGNDQLGSVMLADIAAEGVDISLAKRVNSFTAAMVRNPGKTAPVEISYLRKGSAASTIEPADILDSYISSARWLHTTGITCAISQSGAATVKHALTKAASLGVKSSFDLNLRRKLWSEADAKKTLQPLAENIELLMKMTITVIDIPDTVEISTDLIEEERPQIKEHNNPFKRKDEDAPGPAFHDKSEKNSKENLGGSYKFKIAAKYKKPKTKGDKNYNRRNKR